METNRPTIITILCAWLTLGAIGNIFFIPLVFREREMWYQALAVTGWLVGIVTIIGLWKMKRWAFFLYTVFNIAGIVLLWILGIRHFESIFYPAVVIGIMYSQYSKLN